jgi:dolichol kinase
MFEHLPAILFFLVFKFAAVIVCGAAKIRILRGAGIEGGTLDLVLSARRESLDVVTLIQSVPERTIRIADAVGRKGMHVLFFLTSMMIVQIMAIDYNAAVFSGIAVGLVTMLAMMVLYRSDTWIGRVLYTPYARVMDGKRARLNMISAQTTGTVQAVLLASLGYLGLFALADERYAYALMYTIYLPVALGDTMGEVVGAFWGKHKLRVLGIGDVNRKSVAGTVAVFLGTLGSLLVVAVFLETPDTYVGLVFVVAVITTITELIAPRSTDSFFIPVVNVAVVTAWFTL